VAERSASVDSGVARARDVTHAPACWGGAPPGARYLSGVPVCARRLFSHILRRDDFVGLLSAPLCLFGTAMKLSDTGRMHSTTALSRSCLCVSSPTSSSPSGQQLAPAQGASSSRRNASLERTRADAKHAPTLPPAPAVRTSCRPWLPLAGRGRAAHLRNDHIDAVTILHFELVWRLVLTDAVAVEEEADRLHGHALPLAKRAHQLLKLRVGLALEEDCGETRE